MFRTHTGTFSIGAVLLGTAALTVSCAVATMPITSPSPDPRDDIASCASGELDDCYSRERMSEFVQNGARLIVDYLSLIGVPHKALPMLTFIPWNGSASSSCVDKHGNDVQHDRSLDYCAIDNTVYVGQSALWDNYQKFGAAGPISGIAHEYGHFAQSVAGVPSPTTATETIRHENQADCFSGAFVNYLDNRGAVERPKDFDSIRNFLTATASAEGPGRNHGTAAERTHAFKLGHSGALPACNEFYPATPLTTHVR
jgi:hypothetical protein